MTLEQDKCTVIELFAGVGGFRLGLEGHPAHPETPGSGWRVIWANQWEPPGTESRQFAYRCYVHHFDSDGSHAEQHANVDIGLVDTRTIPDATLLVGGFPCQDYSVAKPLNQAKGIEGRKGVLWWQIYRVLAAKLPPFVLLENVDRLLKSPVSRRGRDFAIILSCFASLGYSVEWRTVNAAEYGFPQKRRRVFIFAKRPAGPAPKRPFALIHEGVLGRALPVGENGSIGAQHEFDLPCMPEQLPTAKGKTRDFDVQTWAAAIGESKRLNGDKSLFANAGVMHRGHVWTAQVKVDPAMKKTAPSGVARTLGEVIAKTDVVSEAYLIPETQVSSWLKHKDSKSLPRTHQGSGTKYTYAEGRMCFPDNLDDAARTVLTSEGGRSAGRSKHAVPVLAGTTIVFDDGKTADSSTLQGVAYRRLTPDELDEISGFPRGWTDTGMKAGQRAFCVGNALVVGIVQLIGEQIRLAATGDC